LLVSRIAALSVGYSVNSLARSAHRALALLDAVSARAAADVRKRKKARLPGLLLPV